jgi:hypothetical protein
MTCDLPLPAPAEVIDPLLWRDAQLMLARHAEPGYDSRCVWCGYRWPCPPRKLAERAQAAARRPAHRAGPAHLAGPRYEAAATFGDPDHERPPVYQVRPARRAAYRQEEPEPSHRAWRDAA